MLNSPLKFFIYYWKGLLLVTIPLALIPLILTGYQEAKCGYVIGVMALFWMMDILPLAVVALIPVFAFPLLGILSSEEVSTVYMVDTNMLFIGGLMVAVAVEHCNLHRRIALSVILKVGQSPRRLQAGFMITTMFLSMWISNTASTAMMVPIVEAIVDELFKTRHTNNQIADEEILKIQDGKRDSKTGEEIELGTAGEADEPSDQEQTNKQKRAIRNMIFLSVAYAANIGGTGALTGTGPNLVLNGILKSSYPDQTDLTFTSWMAYNVPGMLICTFIGWLWLQMVYIGFGKRSKFANPSAEGKKAVKKIIQSKYDELGPMTFHELMVLLLFFFLVIMWLFREPGFIHGWSHAFEGFHGEFYRTIDDGAPAILIAVLLFVFPKQLNFWPFRKPSDPDFNKPSEALLVWPVVHKKLPWGLVILIGSGFAMAAASKESGLSSWMGEQFRVIDFMPLPAIVFLISILVAMATEVASNTATASILMPVLRDLSTSLCINPLYLMMPAAICCSFAFMLPVATPPNAIIFGASGMPTREMLKIGLGMNIICVIVCTILINTYAVFFFDLNTIPLWMNTTSNPLPLQCLNSTF